MRAGFAESTRRARGWFRSMEDEPRRRNRSGLGGSRRTMAAGWTAPCGRRRCRTRCRDASLERAGRCLAASTSRSGASRAYWRSCRAASRRSAPRRRAATLRSSARTTDASPPGRTTISTSVKARRCDGSVAISIARSKTSPPAISWCAGSGSLAANGSTRHDDRRSGRRRRAGQFRIGSTWPQARRRHLSPARSSATRSLWRRSYRDGRQRRGRSDGGLRASKMAPCAGYRRNGSDWLEPYRRDPVRHRWTHPEGHASSIPG